MKRRITRLSPGQTAKMLAALYALAGVLVAPLFLLAALNRPAGAPAIGPGFAIGIPIAYGIGGFIGGALLAWLYNLVAGYLGGIEVEVEVEDSP